MLHDGRLESCSPSCTMLSMRFPTGGVVPNRGIEVGTRRHGVTVEALYVWVPTADELIELEHRHGLVFGTADVSLDDLSEALVRWRSDSQTIEPLTPKTWEITFSGLRIPIPVIARPSSAHPVQIIEGHASIATLLSLQPVPQTAPVLVATERL